MPFPVIPEYITVHLGNPTDFSAPNVRIPFVDYIKNVASSEIYPTWPESAIRANIYAQVSYALNRIYTEWYPSQGYQFDITNTTQFDQSFVANRDIFEPISRIVDNQFNDYVVRQGFIQPLFTQYCNGTTSTCAGLSQWGTVSLAEEGLSPYEILQYYYGSDIDLVLDAPVGENIPSYPGLPLSLGDGGEEIRTLKRQLNRIARNYPAILTEPLEITEFFDIPLEEAVRNFQGVFNLPVTGVVDKSTWYRIKYIFNGIKKLSELQSEGLTLSEADRIYPGSLSSGSSGTEVKALQYYLGVIAFFDDEIPLPEPTGVFDTATEASVTAFQRSQNLPVTGIADRETWNQIQLAYDRTIASIPEEYLTSADEIFPGIALTPGQTGPQVEVLQRFLVLAAERDPAIPAVTVTGVYDDATEAAVRAVQEIAGYPVNGVTGPLTWDRIVRLAKGE